MRPLIRWDGGKKGRKALKEQRVKHQNQLREWERQERLRMEQLPQSSQQTSTRPEPILEMDAEPSGPSTWPEMHLDMDPLPSGPSTWPEPHLEMGTSPSGPSTWTYLPNNSTKNFEPLLPIRDSQDGHDD